MRVLGQYGLAETLINKGGVKITGARFLNYHDGEVLYQRQMPKNGVVKPPGLQAWYVEAFLFSDYFEWDDSLPVHESAADVPVWLTVPSTTKRCMRTP